MDHLRSCLKIFWKSVQNKSGEEQFFVKGGDLFETDSSAVIASFCCVPFPYRLRRWRGRKWRINRLPGLGYHGVGQ